MITIEKYAQINNKSIKVYENLTPRTYNVGVAYSMSLCDAPKESTILPRGPYTQKTFHTTKPISVVYPQDIMEDGTSIYVPYNLIADTIRKDLTAKT